MGAIGEAAETLRARPAMAPDVTADSPLLRRMLDQQSLSSVRTRFLHRLLHDEGGPAAAEAAEAGDVELF